MSEDIKKIETAIDSLAKSIEKVDMDSKSAKDDFAKKLDEMLVAYKELTTKKEETRNQTRIFKSDQDALAFGEWLAAGPLSQVQPYKGNLKVEKDISSASNGAGAYLLPEQFDSTFRKLIPQFGRARQYHNVRELEMGKSLEYVKEDAPASASWQAAASDGGSLSTTAPTFLNKVITPEVLYALTYSSKRAILQSRVTVADLVAQNLAQAIGTAEDTAVVRGDGTSTYGSITGYAYDTDMTEVQVTNLTTYKANTSGATVNKLIDLVNSVHESVIDGNTAAFYMHTNFINVTRGLKDGNGQPIWQQSFQAGVPSTLLGYPVFSFNRMNYGATAGSAGEAVIIFGDLRRAGEIVTNGPMSIDLSEHVKFNYGQVAWRAFSTFGFGIILPSAVARLTLTA